MSNEINEMDEELRQRIRRHDLIIALTVLHQYSLSEIEEVYASLFPSRCDGDEHDHSYNFRTVAGYAREFIRQKIKQEQFTFTHREIRKFVEDNCPYECTNLGATLSTMLKSWSASFIKYGIDKPIQNTKPGAHTWTINNKDYFLNFKEKLCPYS